MASGDDLEDLGPTLKRAVATLRDTGVPFLLGGSLACWARGGPRSENDLDLMVSPADAERALQALAQAGMRPERPPEEWLFKAWDGEVLVDLIFGPAGLELSEEVFARAEELAVLAVTTPVMALEDVLTTMLLALDERCLDYRDLVAIARSLREQIDFGTLRRCTEHSPYAAALLHPGGAHGDRRGWGRAGPVHAHRAGAAHRRVGLLTTALRQPARPSPRRPRRRGGSGAGVSHGLKAPSVDGHAAVVRAHLDVLGRLVEAGLPAHGAVVAIAPLACKTDRVDARVLAGLVRRDLVPTVWVPPLDDRAIRECLRRRSHLIRLRTPRSTAPSGC